MAYFHDKHLLFIHIPKNAGKSVEVALGLAGHRALPRLGRRSGLNRVAMGLLRQSENREARTVLHGSLDITLCAQHLTLQEIQLLDLLPRTAWEGLRSFAVCRNPFSRALSSYRHFRAGGKADPQEFEHFCETWYDEPASDHNCLSHQRTQLDFILDRRGRQGVDRILRFENLAADFKALCSDWDIEAPELPHVGKQGTGSGAYRELYTDRARALISERFAEDIDFLGYQF